MNKKIITIAEIVFALVFVVLLAVFMATINSKGNSANSKLVDTLEMTDGASMDAYANLNGETCKGTMVITAATNYKTIGGDTKVEIRVNTKKDNTRKHYGYFTDGGKLTSRAILEGKFTQKANQEFKIGDEIGAYTTPQTSAADYINPNANFTVSCVPGTNGLYSYIEFTQK